MASREDELSLRDLIAQLIDAGKAYARAEIAYFKQLATSRLTGAATGAGLAVAALLVLQAALTVLLAAVGMALAQWLGTAGGMAVAAVLGLALAGLLGWLGYRSIVASGGTK